MNEDFKLKIIILGENITSPKLQWRPLGKSKYNEMVLKNLNRSVYQVIIPGKDLKDDFEYYIDAKSSNGMLTFPSSHPNKNQTVVIF